MTAAELAAEIWHAKDHSAGLAIAKRALAAERNRALEEARKQCYAMEVECPHDNPCHATDADAIDALKTDPAESA